jgi:hypothetical protein
MIFIESPAKKKKVLEFIVAYRNLQKQVETDDTFVYSIIPLKLAIKYNVLFKDFLLHKSLLKRRKFYEPVHFATNKKDLSDAIAMVLEHELSGDHPETLSMDTIKKLAKVHTRLTKTRKTKND